jgi:hypothetical protein
MPNNLQQVNDLVALGETTRHRSVYQAYADSTVADPNAAVNPAAVGVGLAGAKSLLVETCAAVPGGTGSLRLWLYRGPRSLGPLVSNPNVGWFVPIAGDLGPIDTIRGGGERFDVSGYARAYVEVYDGAAGGLDVVYGLGVLP